MESMDLELDAMDDKDNPLRELETEIRGLLLSATARALHKLTGVLIDTPDNPRALRLVQRLSEISTEIRHTLRCDDDYEDADGEDGDVDGYAGNNAIMGYPNRRRRPRLPLPHEGVGGGAIGAPEQLMERVLQATEGVRGQNEEVRVTQLLNSLPATPAPERTAFVRERLVTLVGEARADALLAEHTPVSPRTPRQLVPHDVSEALDAATLPEAREARVEEDSKLARRAHLRSLLCALLPGQFEELVSVHLRVVHHSAGIPRGTCVDNLMRSMGDAEVTHTLELIQRHYCGG